MKKWLAILVFLLAITLIPYLLAARGLLTLDAAARTNAPGEFAELENGRIHYKWSGPESGDIVILLHGFSTPSFVFEQNASALAERGFRVLQFDHFGRGWSDRPKAKYDAGFYDRELLQLIQHFDIREKVGLVGYSMGGVIAAEFTARHPERVSGLFLLAPAGLDTSGADGFAGAILNTPLLGEWVWTIFGRSILLGDPQYDEADLDKTAGLQGDVKVQMRYKGYFPALLSSLRNLDMSGREDIFRKIAETNVAVQALYGSEDNVVPPTNAVVLEALLPAAHISFVSGGDHGFPYKRSGEVNPVLIDFFAAE